jgi:hypothetical protein
MDSTPQEVLGEMPGAETAEVLILMLQEPKGPSQEAGGLAEVRVTVLLAGEAPVRS